METRRRFHDELQELEDTVLKLGELAQSSLDRAIRLLDRRDDDEAAAIVDGDDIIDETFIEVEKRWFELLALQTPVAKDLRLISVILHTAMHLERIGDMAVNISKIVTVTKELPTNDAILTQLREMGDIVRPMIRTALGAFADRDLEAAKGLPGMDDPVDRLNRRMYLAVVACADDQDLLEWATHMMIVSRQLERVGDHAVDIGEQVAFLLTGEFQEFSDASHPEDDGD